MLPWTKLAEAVRLTTTTCKKQKSGDCRGKGSGKKNWHDTAKGRDRSRSAQRKKNAVDRKRTRRENLNVKSAKSEDAKRGKRGKRRNWKDSVSTSASVRSAKRGNAANGSVKGRNAAKNVGWKKKNMSESEPDDTTENESESSIVMIGTGGGPPAKSEKEPKYLVALAHQIAVQALLPARRRKSPKPELKKRLPTKTRWRFSSLKAKTLKSLKNAPNSNDPAPSSLLRANRWFPNPFSPAIHPRVRPSRNPSLRRQQLLSRKNPRPHLSDATNTKTIRRVPTAAAVPRRPTHDALPDRAPLRVAVTTVADAALPPRHDG